ncbi:hypothetical protein PIB30_008323 [Stylosanthes scabra]|uniref:Transposase (Putative), gypsy type n=1 Tax=Stylosanthes scabra TaxID=79078 RepID=A0ABU6S560_9FABA|nr:hypothetical protein [Stylosanthes scabra]
MGKKRSCQDVRESWPLNEVEAQLYGWVDEEVFTQPSVIPGGSLSELRHNIRLMRDARLEEDYVLEAAGPSDRVLLRAEEGNPHFLWVYQELFTCLGVTFPLMDFQRFVLTRCKVAVNQLHLNGWGFLQAFERVCLHFGFRPTSHLFLYIYDVLFPPFGKGYVSFRAHKGHRLLGSYEESIQEFKWHYFKVLAALGKRAFWLDDEGNPYPWVYWNPRVKDFSISTLEPLESAACDFLLSLLSDLPKRNNFSCHWILDHSNADVGKFLDDLLLIKMKKTKLDQMMAMMADPSRRAPRAVLPTGVPSATAAAAATSSAATSSPNPTTLAAQVPPPPPVISKTKKSSAKRERPEAVNVEEDEGAKEDPAADLKQKRRQKDKGKEEDLLDRVLGEESAWEHAVNPLDLAFPREYNYRKVLDGGLTSSSMRKHLKGMLPDQLLGELWRLSYQSLACFQIGLESALAAKTKAEEALLAAEDQASVLKVERDSSLEKVARLDEDIKVLKAQPESAQLSVSRDQKRAESAESSLKALAVSLEATRAELGKATEEANYWCTEWKNLGTEAQEMCQETLEIVLNQVSHLCPGVHFSAITLKTHWDPKGKRIHIPNEAPNGDVEAVEALPEVTPEQQLEQQLEQEAVGDSGECPT